MQMTVHALVSQCAEPRERCFEVFRMQNSQNFPGLRPWTPPGRVDSAPHKKIAGYGLHLKTPENL